MIRSNKSTDDAFSFQKDLDRPCEKVANAILCEEMQSDAYAEKESFPSVQDARPAPDGVYGVLSTP